jgi:ABC-2 type transport system ATP-binding protein
MEEADALCQRLAIIDHGRMIALGSPQQLKASIPGGYLLRLRFGNQTAALLDSLRALTGVREVRAHDKNHEGSSNQDGAIPGIDLYADRGGSLIPEIASVAANANAELSDVHISEPSLENLFLHHTGRSLRD